MHTPQTDPIVRRTYDTAELMAKHPPRISHANKREIYRIACPLGCCHVGRVAYSRWSAIALPATRLPEKPDLVEPRGDIFDYVPLGMDAPTVEWHMNFADPDLFFGYGGGLFAQDEIQVAEHPALAAVREALVAEGLDPLTVENGQPTPVLVAGVQRRCRVRTDASAAEGRPYGLYGRSFAAASPQAVHQATQAIEPPTISNILAVAALRGAGVYTEEQIRHILQTAYSGFAAAKSESVDLAGPQAHVVIHTGYWGCGAFGGHRVLMTVLQILAARLAAVDRLVFHTVNRAGRPDFDKALVLLEQELAPVGQDETMQDVLQQLVSMQFGWGVSDGN